MNDEIMEKMGDYEQEHVKLVYNDDSELEGYIDVFCTRYDNDGEASICFAGVNGEMLIVEESELKDIILL